MQTVQPKFAVTATEVQTIITGWAQATEDLHYKYCQVDEAINGLHQNQRSSTGLTGSKRTSLLELLKLRQYMSDVLATLLSDMGNEPAKNGGSATLSKPGQLTAHTRLILEINRKVAAELTRLMATGPDAKRRYRRAATTPVERIIVN